MRRCMTLLALACGVASSSCITSFRHPLGPVEDGFIESGLTGTWSCTSADDPSPGLLTIVDFDGRQYYMEFLEQGKDRPGRFRGHATRLEGLPFLNLLELGRDGDAEWTIMEYDLAEADRLTFRVVEPEPFEDVIEDAAAVRERLSTRLRDLDVTSSVLTCNRTRDAQ